jgi:hypothetical protein
MVPGPDQNVVGVFVFEESASVTYGKDGVVGVRHTGGVIDASQAMRAHFDGRKWVAAEVGRA